MGYREARLIQGLTPRRQGAEGLRRKRLRRREASAIMDVESNTVKILNLRPQSPRSSSELHPFRETC